MTLKEKINKDMKEALKTGDKIKLSTLRLLISEMKNVEIAKRKELDDEGILEVLARQVKKRKESIAEYEKAGREDLRDKERKEAEILQEYLPPQLTEEELKKVISEVIEELGATSLKDMGKVMALVMSKVKGRAEGKLVNDLVKEALSTEESA